MNGVASVLGSASDAKEAVINEIGRSGLSIAVLPTVAQNSSWPAIVRCSDLASDFAASYRLSSILTGMPIKNLPFRSFYYKSSKIESKVIS
jgi:hypothetical protein